MTVLTGADMYDATLPQNIPSYATFVGGYVDGAWPWMRTQPHVFPNARKFTFCVFATEDAMCLDVERGNATPAQAPGWAVRQRGRGADPVVYCSELGTYGWQAVQDAFTAARVPQPHYGVATYNGTRALPVLNGLTAIFHQYVDTGPYDLSSLSDTFIALLGGTVTAANSPDDDLILATLYGSNRQAGPDGVLRNVFDNFNVINGTLGLVMKALSGLTAEDTTILTATQGVDADVKAGIAQLAATIKTGVDVPTLAAALAAVLVPLLPPDVTPAQIGAAVEAAIAAQFAK